MAEYQGEFDAGTASANVDGILEFFEYWFGDIMAGTIEVGWKDTETGKLNQFKRFDVGDIDECAEFCAETNAVPGQNIYFRPCLIKEDAPKFVTDKDAIIAPGIWVDLDTEGAAAQAKNIYSTCQPTSITVTGREPWTRAQLFWKFTEQAGASELIQNLNKSAQRKLQGDPAVTNVSTLMRVPATISWPWKEGRKVEQVESVIRHDRPKLTWARIQAAFPMPEKEERKAAEFFDDGEYEGLDPQEHLKAIDKGDQLHINTRDLVAHMVGAGYPDWLIQQLTERALKPVSDGGTLSQVPSFIDSARTKYNQPDPGVAKEAAPVGDFFAQPFDPEQMLAVPKRDWLYDTHLIGGFISCTVSPGGVGKTTLALIEAIALITGRPLLGIRPSRQVNVLHINLEDPLDELLRRVAAICSVYDVDPQELRGKLFLNSGRNTPLIVADIDKNGNMTAMPVIESLEKTISENDIGLVQIDPMVKCHYLDENLNKHIDFVCTLLAGVADRTGCAFDLVHHTRKTAPGATQAVAGNMETARGAGALIGAVRAGRTITVMNEKEAATFDILPHKRGWYIRVDDGKGNMSPPAEKAFWLQRVSVEIDNGTDMDGGDSVGCLKVWEPPDAWAEFTADQLRSVIKILARGITNLEGEEMMYSPTVTGKARCPSAAFKAVKQDVMIGTVKTILKQWAKDGIAIKGECVINRKPAAGLEINYEQFIENYGAGDVTEG